MKKQPKKKKKKGTRKKSQPKSMPQISSEAESGSSGEEKERKKRPVQPVSKKEPDKKRGDRGSLVKYVHVAGQFLREAKMELKKVKWPTRKELLASTATVIFLVLIVALYLGLIDFGLIKIIKNIVSSPSG